MKGHDIVLRAPGFLPGGGGGPAVLERTDQEFIPAVLARLGDAGGQAELASSLAVKRNGSDHLKLFQPIHRTFNVVLLEALCESLGEPRLDPTRIESAGLVVRRLAARNPRGKPPQGWMESENRLRGWLDLEGAEADADPEAERRPRRIRAGNPEIDRRLAAVGGPGEKVRERVSPLFVAPPDVCARAGRTVLYGVLPVISSEMSEAPAEPVEFSGGNGRSAPAGETDPARAFEKHLSVLLKSSKEKTYSWNGKTLRASDLDDPARHPHLDTLVLCLEQLSIEFGAFGDSAAGKALFATLNKVKLRYGRRRLRAGRLLRDASRVLIDRRSSPSSVKMPDRWPRISASLRSEILRRARSAAESRLSAIAPGEGRFDGVGRLYQVRALIRVKRSDGCPPWLVWSDPSEPFAIAPWYESGAAPPVQIALPDATDRNFLEGLKPNVSFAVPEPIFNKLRGSKLGDLMEGKSGGDGGIGLGWICGFNIPIITLCAFIVLSIFLQLLNFIFFWLPFVKICIPFPRTEE